MKTRAMRVRAVAVIVWLGAAGASQAGGDASERMSGAETNYQIAAARCAVAKRCFADRAKTPCDQADKLKATWDAAKDKTTDHGGTYRDDLDSCLDAVAKAECTKVHLDLISFMTDANNKACAGYGDYYHHKGRYAKAK